MSVAPPPSINRDEYVESRVPDDHRTRTEPVEQTVRRSYPYKYLICLALRLLSQENGPPRQRGAESQSRGAA